MSTPKRIKLEAEQHEYAALDFECGSDDDEISIQRNIDLLKKEVTKPKCKSSLVKELVKRTLKPRRAKVLGGSSRPNDVFLEFPHLKKSTYVS